MKCISDFGNLFFNNLGTGVDKTTSPNEENLITKIFILFIFIFSNSNLVGQSNLDSIVYQKKRIEFKIQDLDRNFWVKENKINFLILKDVESGKYLNWIFKLYNKELKLINDTTISLDRSYTIVKISSDKNNYNLFFKKNYSNEKEYLFIRYNTLSNSFITKEIKLPLSLSIRNILFIDEKIILLSSLRNGKNLVSVYNTLSGQLNNIYEYLYYDNEIINIYKSQLSSFYVLLSKVDENNFKVVERKDYTLNNKSLNTYVIQSSNKSIIHSKLLSHNDTDYYVSLVGKKNSNEANGFQINILNKDSLSKNKEINFLQIPDLINFFSNENKIFQKKIKNKNVENLKLGYEFFIDTLFILNDEIHFAFESLKANFTNDGFSNYSYMPFYNSYSGRYDNKINPKFGGFTHDISIYLISDLSANIKWASINKIHDLNTFYKKPYKNYILKNDQIIDFYVNKGKITLSRKKLFSKDKMDKAVLDLNSEKEFIVLTNETNPEGTIHWYNNNYLSYGIQKIKKRNTNKVSSDRVFFISNYEIN